MTETVSTERLTLAKLRDMKYSAENHGDANFHYVRTDDYLAVLTELLAARTSASALDALRKERDAAQDANASLSRLVDELDPTFAASRTQEPAEWQVEAGLNQLLNAKTLTPRERVKAILRAATPPAPERKEVGTLSVDEVERIILDTEPPQLSDKSDKIWTRRMATALAARLSALTPSPIHKVEVAESVPDVRYAAGYSDGYDRGQQDASPVPLPVTITPDMVDRSGKALVKEIRNQDPEWAEDYDEGEYLIVSPSGDYFAINVAARACLTAALSTGEQG